MYACYYTTKVSKKDYEQVLSGTSASAPLVTGVAGILKAIKPSLTPAQIKDILIRTADPIQTDQPIGGRLNAYNAICDSEVGLNCAPPVSEAANGSFENGIEPGMFTTVNAINNTDIANWSVISGGIDYVGSYWAASDGVRSIDMNSTITGSISQSFPTVIGTMYTVTFDLSGNPDVLSASDPYSYYSSSTKVIEVNATGSASKDFTYDTSVKGNSRSDMKWEKQRYTFVATGENTVLTFTSKISGAFGPVLDNVLVIPAPALSTPEQFQSSNIGAVPTPAFSAPAQYSMPSVNLLPVGTVFSVDNAGAAME